MPDSIKLKILDALAARKHGVSVVVAYPPDSTGTTQALASVTRFSRENRLTQFPWRFTLFVSLFSDSPNPLQKRSPAQPPHSPTVIDLKETIPEYLKDIDSPALLLDAFNTENQASRPIFLSQLNTA